MKLKTGDSAVSEIIGTIILLFIAVSTFSAIYLNVLSDNGPNPEAYVTITGRIESGEVIFTHQRGEALDLESQVLLTIAGEHHEQLSVKDLLDDISKSDGLWNIGEQLSFSQPNIDLTDKQVEATIVDKDSNSLVFWGTLQEGYMGPLAPYCWEQYSLFSLSETQDTKIEWPGSTTTINGDIHANRGVQISGSDNTINGTITYVEYFEDSGSSNTYDPPEQISPLTFPLNYNISYYQPGGTEAVKAQNEGKYYHHNGDYFVSSGTPGGLHYVTGNVKTDDDYLTLNCTIVAEGNIEISKTGCCLTSYCNDLVFYGLGNEFKLSGQYNTLYGISYMPDGTVYLSGSNHIIVGGFYASVVVYGGSNCLITSN